MILSPHTPAKTARAAREFLPPNPLPSRAAAKESSPPPCVYAMPNKAIFSFLIGKIFSRALSETERENALWGSRPSTAGWRRLGKFAKVGSCCVEDFPHIQK